MHSFKRRSYDSKVIWYGFWVVIGWVKLLLFRSSGNMLRSMCFKCNKTRSATSTVAEKEMNFKFKIVKHVSIHNIVHCIRSSMNSNNNKLDSYYNFLCWKKYSLSATQFSYFFRYIYIIILSNFFFFFYPNFLNSHVSYQITKLRMKSYTIFNAHKEKMCFAK